MSLGDMFGKFTTMFKKEEPKPQPFLGQTTPPEQSGIMGQFNKWNPFAKGGKSKKTKQKKTKTKTKRNRK
jgi:hypothetical protein